MSSSHMEQFAVWGHNSHTKPEDHGSIDQITDYVVYEVPRSMFRQAASMFSDVRHADEGSRYDEITLQMFLQMVFETINLEDDEVPSDCGFPYAKAWLEWVPKEDNPSIAVSYRIHAVSHSDSVRFGKYLSKMLFLSASMHKDSNGRKMNSRKADPLAGLYPYQKWQRVNGLEMYLRTVCDRYSGTQNFTSQMKKFCAPRLNCTTQILRRAILPIHPWCLRLTELWPARPCRPTRGFWTVRPTLAIPKPTPFQID